ncbi:MAG: hypothetical protein FJX80_07915 [Bacteroidetes bacterium]|nr:hypothetical protein [Bacteroidota bacterium]
MKTSILMSFLFFLHVTCYAQLENEKVIVRNMQSPTSAKYRLFPTENTWTYLKLNTSNGKVEQIQWSLDGDRMAVKLNDNLLVATQEEKIDRFTLYPTKNLFNFLLLDQIDGRVWQLQWSTKSENRGIIEITGY